MSISEKLVAAKDLEQAPTARITTFTATAIAVADMVGIGVFTSLGFQVLGIQSGFSLIALWIVGGVVALCGALSYAELAAALPRSGGEYNFLGRVYHPAAGFMAGWLSATVGFAAPTALASMAFAAYFADIVPGSPAKVAIALGVAWMVGLVHIAGLRHGAKFHNLFTVFKVVLIVVFIAAGFALGEPQPISFAPTSADLGQMTAAPFAISLVYVMYSYSGWNASTYIINEIDRPARSVPVSLFAATMIVITLYVGLNAAFLYSTPIDAMAGKIDVALIAGRHIFGDAGGQIVGGLICLGLISAISAMMWIGPRVTEVMGEDIAILKPFAKRWRNGAPVRAIALQLVVVSILILTDSFEGVLQFIQFALTLSSFLAVLGVIVLRLRRPEIERPFRAFAYPFTPLIFLSVTGGMLYYLAVEKPLQSLASVAILAAGFALYFLLPKSSRQQAIKERHSNA